MSFNDFKLQSVQSSLSSKTQLGPSKPCQIYIQINIKQASAPLNYICFKNYYCYSITIKQLLRGQKSDANWVIILHDLKLMNNAHFQGDAQNWHIISTDQFNSNYDKSNLKYLRIYLKQPSPNWIDYTLKSIQCFTRKSTSFASLTYGSGSGGGVGDEEYKKVESPFDKFCSAMNQHKKTYQKCKKFDGMPFEGKLSQYQQVRKVDIKKHY